MNIKKSVKILSQTEDLSEKEIKAKSLIKKGVTDEDILEILNCVKNEEAGLLLKCIGFPRLTEFVDQILTLYQDINWPINAYTFDLLKVSDKEILLSSIKKIFKNHSTDSLWHSFILSNLVRLLPPDYQKELVEELKQLTVTADRDSACFNAAQILFENNLIVAEEKKEIFNFLTESFKHNKDFNEDLKDLAKFFGNSN